MDIDKHIASWKKQLILARDPREQELALHELNRLMEIRELVIKKYNTEAGAVATTLLSKPPFQSIAQKEILIIHGQDEEMKRHVQLFLTLCNFRAIVWSEEPDKNLTIIEKLTIESDRFCHVIALLSPDDMLADGNAHARQNVIFEIGYYMGKMGRERMSLVVKPNVIIPSDLHGILFIHYDSAGAWKMSLEREIKELGY